MQIYADLKPIVVRYRDNSKNYGDAAGEANQATNLPFDEDRVELGQVFNTAGRDISILGVEELGG